jgi:cbb3-type cytochrome oxidase subunit 3
MSKNYFFLLLIIFIIMTVYYIHNTKKKAENDINEYKQIINNLESNKTSENKPINTTNIIKTLPVRKLLEYRDRSVLYDPLVAPERRVDVTQYPFPVLNQINIPTRGYPDNYQLLGLVSRPGDEKILQLFGRATFPGSNQYEYYVTTESNGFSNKIPIETKGKKEIEDGTSIKIPVFDQNKGDFQIKLYNYNTPRYNPYVF